MERQAAIEGIFIFEYQRAGCAKSRTCAVLVFRCSFLGGIAHCDLQWYAEYVGNQSCYFVNSFGFIYQRGTCEFEMKEKINPVEQHEDALQDRARLVDMQSRITYQERTIQHLSDEVFLQSKRISDLEQTCRKLADRIGALSQASPPADPLDEKPPHY